MDGPRVGGFGGSVGFGAGQRTPPVLDQAFDAGTLYALRVAVQSQARRAGMAENRAGDVVLAVHELAANAIRHGGGSGRLRMWHLAGTLRCQVDDAGPGTGHGTGARRAAGAVARAGRRARPAGAGDHPTVAGPWPPMPGHGLWVAREVADQMEVVSGPEGTRAAVTFALDRAPGR